jgi:diaminohydroxyphosphoribosylaminopyrimidine deaminase / 5-amino-6-(5-phosphoribosylamino)uracil reductase
MRSDEHWMEEAMAAAASVRRLVSPRPWVGAVVVARDGAVFRGATQGQSGPHAEVGALRDAAERARGGTLYVTLEPCAHFGKTPPCADAVIDAGIARCVVGVGDPDARVAGRGLARLRAAGIEVTEGVLGEQVAEQLSPYLHHRRTGRPLVVLKLAATLDGRTAAGDGTSQWITGPQARLDAHRLRADSDAILVGAGTVRADDPALTARLPEGELVGTQPLRVVLGRAPAGAKVHPCLEHSGGLAELLDELGQRGVLQLMVEGGATVAQDFHRQGLVDRYVVFLAPALLAGAQARSMFAGPGGATLGELVRGRWLRVERVGEDLRLELAPLRGTQGSVQ